MLYIDAKARTGKATQYMQDKTTQDKPKQYNTIQHNTRQYGNATQDMQRQGKASHAKQAFKSAESLDTIA